METFQRITAFCIMALFLILSTSQVKPTNTKQPITDSLAVISLKDIRQFDTWLKDNVSVSGYSKLTPETTLMELWNWKIRQLSDTTKAKK